MDGEALGDGTSRSMCDQATTHLAAAPGTGSTFNIGNLALYGPLAYPIFEIWRYGPSCPLIRYGGLEYRVLYSVIDEAVEGLSRGSRDARKGIVIIFGGYSEGVQASALQALVLQALVHTELTVLTVLQALVGCRGGVCARLGRPKLLSQAFLLLCLSVHRVKNPALFFHLRYPFHTRFSHRDHNIKIHQITFPHHDHYADDYDHDYRCSHRSHHSLYFHRARWISLLNSTQ